MGLIDTYRNLHAAYSNAANGAAVAIIDYRTAPEHKYPAAHDDIMKGWEFLQTLGYEPEDIILAGDSSGGNLVLSLLLRLRDEKRPMPGAAVIMSPWTDLFAKGASYKTNYNNDIVFGRRRSIPNDAKIQKLLKCGMFTYVGDADKNSPYLSPALGEYHGMPPILMTVGSHEMLLDDTLTVAEKIKAAGGDITLIIGEGMFHAYPMFYMISPTANDTFKQILYFLHKHTCDLKEQIKELKLQIDGYKKLIAAMDALALEGAVEIGRGIRG
jgi:acetyl esterase/lipase